MRDSKITGAPSLTTGSTTSKESQEERVEIDGLSRMLGG